MRHRAVLFVRQHAHEHASPWSAIKAAAAKLGCSAESVRRWVRRMDEQSAPSNAGSYRTRLSELERENRELRRMNEVLRRTSSLLAGELGRLGHSRQRN